MFLFSISKLYMFPVAFVLAIDNLILYALLYFAELFVRFRDIYKRYL